MTSVACTCKQWKENIHKINDVLVFVAITRGWIYNAPPFAHCPWCGKKLEEDLDKKGQM
jgi:hypothetical protein